MKLLKKLKECRSHLIYKLAVLKLCYTWESRKGGFTPDVQATSQANYTRAGTRHKETTFPGAKRRQVREPSVLEEYLSPRTTGVWGWALLCHARGCPAPCQVFRSIPGLYPLDAGTNPMSADYRKRL